VGPLQLKSNVVRHCFLTVAGPQQANCFACVRNRSPQPYFSTKKNGEGRAASFLSGDERKLVADSIYCIAVKTLSTFQMT